MSDVWVPQWERVDIGGPAEQDYTDEDNVKVLWHTWEGTNWGAAESSFAPYPPHCGAKIFDHVRQYVPLNKRAFALAGSNNEKEFVIQIEVAGFAHDSRDMTQDEKAWLAHNVLMPILFFFPNVPDVHPQFYDDQDGITLASKNSPIRFAFADWVKYSGHVGHQHAPSPDEHWDPGRLDLDTIIRLARQEVHGPEEDDDLADSVKPHFGKKKGSIHVHLVQRDYASKRLLTPLEAGAYKWVNGTRGGRWLDSPDVIEYDKEVWDGIPYVGAKAPDA